MCDQQHGYKRNKSTVTAIVQVVDNITRALDEKLITEATYCDLSKAFDRVSHQILINKLEYYGVRGTPLKLLESYLSNRRQCVVFNGRRSTWKYVGVGVPQGSILGPLLFLVYVNDLPANIRADDMCLFADDTSFFNTAPDVTSAT